VPKTKKPKKYPRWDRLGINPIGYVLAEILSQPVEVALTEMMKTATATSPARAVDDLAFIAKQVVWDTADRMGLLVDKRKSCRSSRKSR